MVISLIRACSVACVAYAFAHGLNDSDQSPEALPYA